MPSSNLAVWPKLLDMAWRCQPTSVCDVGPGLGKGGLLLREYVSRDLRIDALEMEPRYITARMRAIYHWVYVGDACQMDERFWSIYSLVWMVDVIEHMEKEPAIDLLRRIPGSIIVCTPIEWFQNPEADEYPSERHRSLWTGADFEALGFHVDEVYGGICALRGPR